MANIIFKKSKAIGLIDIIVGISLIIIIFLGIFGAYQAGVKIVAQARDRIRATAIANEKIEIVKNLPYSDVGLSSLGAYPSGVLSPIETISREGKIYKVETSVDFVVDKTDGLASPDDQCPYDYKRVKIIVSWGGKFPGKVKFATDVAPANISEECAEKGGILSLSVFDALGNLLPGVSVRVEDTLSPLVKECLTGADGDCLIPLPSTPPGQQENYKVLVSKVGYSKDETFKTGDSYGSQTIITPEKPNPTIFEAEVANKSLSIDLLSNFIVYAASSGGLLDGSVLAPPITQEEPQGDFYFQVINEMKCFTPNEQIENRRQQTVEKINNLSSSEERQLNILNTLLDAIDSYLDEGVLGLPLNNVSFQLRGEKSVGVDSKGSTIPKYPLTSYTIANKSKEISEMEWDTYYFSNFESEKGDMNLEDSCPGEILPDGSLSVALDPGGTKKVVLFLETGEMLPLTIVNKDTGDPLFPASATLEKNGYEETLSTNERGKVYFLFLENGTYKLSVRAEGYEDYQTDISIPSSPLEIKMTPSD